MNRSALAIISALVLYGACFCQRAHSQTRPAKKAPDATVSGKITIKGKTAPGIIVGLRRSQYEPGQSDSGFKATTDQDGRYRITDVPAGSYQVAPVAPAFVISDINKSWGQNLIVAEGDNIAGIDFDLVKGGVITGKVTDADGHPIVEEGISLVAADYPRSGPAGIPVFFQTDDRGIYRMFGIRPGRYKVSIGEENFGINRGYGKGRSLPMTFYPDVSDAAKARVIEIGEGTEAINIDITIAAAPRNFSVSGRVVDAETGKAVTDVTISLQKITVIDASSSSGVGGGTDVRSNADGEFRLDNLPAGKYSISIQPPPESDLRAKPVGFDLIDQDVTDLLIKTTTGASLSGTVLLEGARDGKNVGAAPAWLSVQTRNDAERVSSNQQAEIKADGSFRIGGLLAGTASFSVGSWSPTGNAKPIPISRVERDGVVQPQGIQIRTGEHISGLRVVAAYASGSIRGVVKMENGTLPSGGRLVVSLFKVGDSNWNTNGGGTAADARGHFLIEGLATGTYEVTVFAFVPEWRQRPRTTKQLVTVTDGESTEVLVTIDLTPPKNP
jgi:5-hydroxyisourate hydrolase-like protein (transthyretin family)